MTQHEGRLNRTKHAEPVVGVGVTAVVVVSSGNICFPFVPNVSLSCAQHSEP